MMARETNVHGAMTMSGVYGELDIILEIVDAKGNRERLLGQLSHLNSAIAAYEAAIQSFATDRIYLRHRAHIIRDSARDR